MSEGKPRRDNLRFGRDSRLELRVLLKDAVQELLVLPDIRAEQELHVLVEINGDAGLQLAQTLGKLVLSFVGLGDELPSRLCLDLTEVPPRAKLLKHRLEKVARDGFVDGRELSHDLVGLGVVRLIVEHAEA